MSSLHHEDGASLTAALVLVALNMPDSPGLRGKLSTYGYC